MHGRYNFISNTHAREISMCMGEMMRRNQDPDGTYAHKILYMSQGAVFFKLIELHDLGHSVLNQNEFDQNQ